MTRPLFISQQPGVSHLSENSEIQNAPMSNLDEDENCFHLKRVGTAYQGRDNTINSSSSHIQTSFQSPSTHHNRLANVASEKSTRQPSQTFIEDRKGETYSETELDGQNFADDILEYDEDNVIVIDLDDIRNNPGKESEVLVPTKTMETPKRRVEIKRQVYYDDSDLFSPPPEENKEPVEKHFVKSKNFNEPYHAPPSDNGTSHGQRQFSLDCLSKDCDPNIDDTIQRITRIDSTPESSSETQSVNSQNDEIISDNINHVSLPPPIQSVLDDDNINQEDYSNDYENDLSQKDIVQPPSPFSERSCSSSATTGASSVKQSHCLGAPSSKSNDINSNTAAKLNETIERKILHPQTSILMESDQPVFYEASKFDRAQIVGLDNHSQLTLSSISSDTVCHQDIQIVPLPISSESNETKSSHNQNDISHKTSLPPVKVHGRPNLTSAAFNNSNNGREYESSAISHKNSQFHGSENQHQFTSIQPLVNEQQNEYKIHKDNNLPSELQKEKRDRPNQLFPSVPTSSSVIINNNSCGTSPLPSAKCRTSHAKNDTGKTFCSSMLISVIYLSRIKSFIL